MAVNCDLLFIRSFRALSWAFVLTEWPAAAVADFGLLVVWKTEKWRVIATGLEKDGEIGSWRGKRCLPSASGHLSTFSLCFQDQLKDWTYWLQMPSRKSFNFGFLVRTLKKIRYQANHVNSYEICHSCQVDLWDLFSFRRRRRRKLESEKRSFDLPNYGKRMQLRFSLLSSLLRREWIKEKLAEQSFFFDVS